MVVVLPLEEEGNKVRLPLFLTNTTIDIKFSLPNSITLFIIGSRRRTDEVGYLGTLLNNSIIYSPV